MKRKAIPIIYMLILYAFPLVLMYADAIRFDSRYYIPIAFIAFVINIFYAFYLYKQKDEKNLKFSMCLMTFGLIPYYLMMLLFYFVVAAFSSGFVGTDSATGIFLIFMVIQLIVQIGSAFYSLNYARIKNLGTVHKILPLIPIFNIIDCIVVLSKNVSRETIER